MLRQRLASVRLRAARQLAELTSGAHRTEEEHLVAVVVIGINQVRAPAPSFGISASPAFGAEELGGSHRTRMMARTTAAGKWPERTCRWSTDVRR
jgi:hypothetical protein